MFSKLSMQIDHLEEDNERATRFVMQNDKQEAKGPQMAGRTAGARFQSPFQVSSRTRLRMDLSESQMGRAEAGERLGCLNVIIASLQNVQDVGLSGESIVGTVKNIPSDFLDVGDEVVNVSVTMTGWGSALGSVMILTY